MNKTILLTGILFGATAVMLGAFGAHGLEKIVPIDAISTFETGVRYQMYHAFLLLILGGIPKIDGKAKKWVFYLITTGVILFSFSIYLLALNSLTDFDFKVIGFVTPIGGLLLILGWMVFGYRIFKQFS